MKKTKKKVKRTARSAKPEQPAKQVERVCNTKPETYMFRCNGRLEEPLTDKQVRAKQMWANNVPIRNIVINLGIEIDALFEALSISYAHNQDVYAELKELLSTHKQYGNPLQEPAHGKKSE